MKTKEIKINELKFIENIDILFDNKIVLYGSGVLGIKAHEILKLLGIPVAYFCDSNVSRWDEHIDGTEILSLPKLKQLDASENIVIIITTELISFIDQILLTILDLNLKTNHVYSLLGLSLSLKQNINDNRINADSRASFIRAHQHSYELQRINSFRFIFDVHVVAIAQCIERCMEKKENILVYGMEKVGSITVSQSLTAIGVLNTHIHYLSPFKSHGGEIIIPEAKSLYRSLLKDQHKIKIITLVREPVSKNLSQFFFSHFRIFQGYHVLPLGDSFIGICQQYLMDSGNTRNPFSWFETELKPFFGIDVYAHPFDKEKGYTIIKQDNIELLLMKLEKLNDLESVISDFVEAPHFKLINSNEGDSMIYKYLYKNVKEALKLPCDYFSGYYKDNPYIDHFYSEDEKNEFRKKWKKNTV